MSNMTSDQAIAAVLDVLSRTPSVDFVYVHPDGAKPAVAVIVKMETPAAYAVRDAYNDMPPHDHIEPGMW